LRGDPLLALLPGRRNVQPCAVSALPPRGRPRVAGLFALLGDFREFGMGLLD
jgi:hypothetical protein